MIPAKLEWAIAKNLAETLVSLRVTQEAETRPCSDALRDIVRDLVELFGEAAGVTGISTSVERIELSSFKGRALVLMAVHLVVEILLFAARTGRSGRVLVRLDRHDLGLGRGRLTVGFSDCLPRRNPFGTGRGVIDDLANLLASDVIYRWDRGQIVAGFEFSLR
jgi:hypothetical protein